jgi:hypothetical protein
VCALDVDYNSSVICNAIGYNNLLIADESKANDEETDPVRTPTKSTSKLRFQHRQFVHHWICLRDIVDGLITCNHVLKGKIIQEILVKMDLWVKQHHEPKAVQWKPMENDLSLINMSPVKVFKARARQLIWDLMEMK